MSSSKNGAFLPGFILGLLVGAAAALLTAPQPGDETRLQMQERGVALRTQFDDLATRAQERGKVLIEERSSRSGATGGDGAVEALEDEGEAAASVDPGA